MATTRRWPLHAHLRSPLPKDHQGVILISGVLPFGRLWYDTPDNAVGYAWTARNQNVESVGSRLMHAVKEAAMTV
jgi:hypothetical protein